MYRYICMALCIATPMCGWVRHGAVQDIDSLQRTQGTGPHGINKEHFVFGPMHRGDSEIADTWHVFLTTDGTAHISNSWIGMLDAQGVTTIDRSSHIDDADISGSTKIHDATAINMDCHGVSDISQAHIQNLMVHGPTDIYDSFIGYANISSKLHMARSRGTSCFTVGSLDMQNSQYDEVSVDTRHASKRDYPLNIGASNIQRVYVYGNKGACPKLHVSDSYLAHVDASSELQMANCRGKSCSAVGSTHMQQSEYDGVTIDARYASTNDCPLHISQSGISKLSVSGNKKSYPILHTYDSNIGRINAWSELEMARCRGTSCSTVGSIDMQQSAYENVTIDARCARSQECPPHIAKSSISKLRLYGEKGLHPMLHLCDSHIGHVDTSSELQMTRCCGESCSTVGSIDMQQSEYDTVTIDMRHANKRDYSVYIAQSSTPHIQVYASKRAHPTLYVYAPRKEVHVRFRGPRGTVVTDCPHMVSVSKGEVSEQCKKSKYT